MNTMKESFEVGVFERFLSTQPSLKVKRWEYTGAGHRRPDFVSRDHIGVELAEWLHQKQTRTARELERFEQEIIAATTTHRMTAFLKSFEAFELQRYTVVLHVREVPRRRGRAETTNRLLGFLQTCAKPCSDREFRYGRVFGQAELPEEIGRYFATVHISSAANDINLGMSIDRGGSFASEDAFTALLAVMREKIEVKLGLYQDTKEERGLETLLLVLHYGRGFIWNTPYHGIGLREGKPLDEGTSRQIITERAIRYVASVDGGAFDGVFLLFDFASDLDCRAIWSRSG